MSNLKDAAKTALTVPLKTSKEFAARILTDGKFAMETKRTNPALYEAGRADARSLGLLGESTSDRTRRLAGVRTPQEPRTYDADEHAARLRFPEQPTRQAWQTQKLALANGDVVSLVGLRKVNPQAWFDLQLSAFSHGLTSRRPEPLPAQPEPEAVGLFPLSDEMANKFGLPKGLQVTTDQLHKLIADHAVQQTQPKSAE